jgi:hypothetical protein
MTQLLEAPATEEVRVAIDFDELLRVTRPVKPKLSEAIRRGSQMTEPGRGIWLSGNSKTGYTACALGAACVGLNEWGFDHNLAGAAKLFPDLLDKVQISAAYAPELFAYLVAEGIEGKLELDPGRIYPHHERLRPAFPPSYRRRRRSDGLLK